MGAKEPAMTAMSRVASSTQALCLLLCRTAASLVLLALLGGPPAEAGGATVKRGLVVLAQFPDVRHQVTLEFVRQRFAEYLTNYVSEASWGAVSLEIRIAPDWITLPDPVARYRIPPQNLNVDKSRVIKLIDDALSAVDPEVDLAAYDFIALMLGARMDEYGMVGLCGYPGMLGWSANGPFRTRSGRMVGSGVAIFTSQAHPGTIFHDVAHVLGGVKDGKRMVPCLYDHDLQSRPGPAMEVFTTSIINMGYWDPMSCHFIKRELPPPGISSWTRLRLGWLPLDRVRTVAPGETAEVLLGPLEVPASEVVAIRIPLSATRYYLIENRQPIGVDKNLPGSGVLIMYADDSVDECRHGQAPVKLVNADPSVPLLQGAAFDAGKKNTFVDTQHNLKVQILEQAGGSCRLRIEAP
jgi:M6 family metalloprotease-like protein